MSLRTSLIVIMVICWFIPIGAISIAANYSQTIITDTMQKSMDAEIEFAVETTMNTLDAVLLSMQTDAYDRTVFTEYKTYMQKYAEMVPTAADPEEKQRIATGLRANLNDQLGKYLNATFVDGKRVDFACLILSGHPYADQTEQICINNPVTEASKTVFDVRTRSEVNRRRQKLHNSLQVYGYNNHQTVQENTFFVIDDRIWVIRNIYEDVDILTADGKPKKNEYYIRDGDGDFSTTKKTSVPTYGWVATLALRLDTESVFEKMLYSDLWGQNVTVMLDTETVNIYPDEQGQDSEITDEQLRTLVSTKKEIYPGKNSLIFYQRIKNPNRSYIFTYRVDVSNDKITASYKGIRSMVVTLLVILVPLVALGAVFVYLNVNLPVSRLVLLAKKMEKGKFGSQIEKKASTKEFKYLFSTMNQTSRQLKYYFERGYQEQINLRDARISALQSQINPHFINNTLELMNWKARLSGDEAVSNMIEALSVMLDANLDKSNQPMIHLEEELRYSDAYLFIIRQRFGDKVKIIKHIDETMLSYLVPRLLIQPFIENAVEHGVEPAGSGSIILDIHREEDNLIIEVINDGKPLSEEDAKKIKVLMTETETASLAPPDKRYTNMGIKNVFQRLRLIFGHKSNLIIGTNENNQTFTRIIIPIEK